jgi:hypothetical protein
MPRYPRPDYIPSAPFSSPVQDNEDGGRSFPVFQTHRQGGTVGFAPSAFSHPRPTGYGSPHDFGGYGGQYDSAPSLNYSQPPSAPSFDRMLGMANRGQIARGPSPGFAAGNIRAAAPLMQFGENARDAVNYSDNRGYAQDANSRLNDYNSAQTGLIGSEGRLNDATAGATSMIAPSTARYNDARSRALDTTAPSEARFNDARATQTSQMPEDWKLREAELMRQLTTLQQSHDRLSNQLRLSQQQGGGGGKQTPMSAGESELITSGAMSGEGALSTIQAARQGKATTQPTSQPSPQPPQQAAPPPVNTYGAQPQQASQPQANLPQGATPNGDGSITMNGAKYVRDEQNKGWRKAG